MKIFVSWSGDTSQKVALALRDWVPSVIQSVEPYVSSEDIDKGARWSTDIAKELEKSSFGVLCITKDNMEAPWLNFEAGALSKSVDKSRVSPFLFGVKRSDVKPGPLLQFQSTLANREETLRLLHSINKAQEPPLLDEGRLESIFDVWWPRLEKQLAEIEKSIPKDSEHKHTPQKALAPEILEEMLVLLRQQQRVLNSPPELLPAGYLREVLGREFEDPTGHPAFEDLEASWAELRVLLSESLDKGSLPKELFSAAIGRVEAPLKYVVRRFGNPHRGFRRRRPAVPSTPTE
jgi:hypothetical protein